MFKLFLKKQENVSLPFLAFLQAFGITFYCSLIGIIMWKGNQWFGPQHSFLGPMLVLTMLVVSVIICGLLSFGYPLVLFWNKKQTIEALKLVMYTAGWLVFFVFFVIFLILLSK